MALAILFFFPFVIMVATSLKTATESVQLEFTLFPETFQWQNYPLVFSTINFLRMYLNTALVAVCIALGQVSLSSMAAFAFARLDFPLKRTLFMLVLAILMIPGQVTLIPNYLIINRLGWLNTYSALIVPNLFSAFGTFFLRQQYMGIPASLDEAAKIDGANPFQIFYKICLPQTYNGILAFAVLSLIFGWNMFLWALIMTTDESMYTLAVGLNFFQGQYEVNVPLMFAAAVMSVT
ncbi:MAG: carbohydrate ABC transporter permease, partial [Spirochaetota bacterium]